MNETLSKTMQELTLDAPIVLDLLIGTSVCAHAKDDLPSLNGVALSAAGGELITVSTDRYRLITGTIKLDDSDLILDQIFIPLKDIKRITAALKALPKRMIVKPTVTFNRAGDLLTVSINAHENSSSITITLGSRGEREFPPYSHLFPSGTTSVEGIAFNPLFMADFGKVPTSNAQIMLKLQFHGDVKPATIEIPHDKITWRGLIMPMRVTK